MTARGIVAAEPGFRGWGASHRLLLRFRLVLVSPAYYLRHYRGEQPGVAVLDPCDLQILALE